MADAAAFQSLREHADALLTRVRGDLQETNRREIELLRETLRTRLAELEIALTAPDADPRWKKFLDEIAAAAAADVDRTCAQVRAEVEAAGHAALTAVQRERDDAQRERDDVRRERDEAHRQRDEAQRHCDDVQRERDDMTLVRDLIQAELDAETAKREAMAAERDGARDVAEQATVDAAAARADLLRATERLRNAAAESASGVLAAVKSALAAIAAAATGPAIVDALIDQVRRHFARALVCDGQADGFVLRRSDGFDPPMSPKTRLRVPADSPVARAATTWVPESSGDEDTVATGLSGAPIRYAIALPLTARDRGAVILYAEDPVDADADPRIAGAIAEVVAGQVSLRLHVKRPETRGEPGPMPTRRARRVKMQEGTSVLVDETASSLVDLSTLGAQVLSTHPLQPNTPVRLQLTAGKDEIACGARVVWVIVERRADPATLVYRTGVEFKDVDAEMFERFSRQFGIADTSPVLVHPRRQFRDS